MSKEEADKQAEVLIDALLEATFNIVKRCGFKRAVSALEVAKLGTVAMAVSKETTFAEFKTGMGMDRP